MKTRKTVYYKRSQISSTGVSTFDLSKGLEALKKRKLGVLKRAESDDGSDDKYRLIATLQFRNNCWCGVLVDFTPGNGVPIVEWADNDEDIDVTSALPRNTTAGKKTDYVNGLLYFIVRDDHVAFIPSRSANSRYCLSLKY